MSEPAYTEEQLKEFAENSKKKYELTQHQRAMETRLRKLKNERLVHSAAGDELEAKRTQRKINELQAKYRDFSENNDLLYNTKRASVEGYRRVSIKDLQDLENRGILKKRIAKGELSLNINPEMQNRHIWGTKEYIEGRSYITISTEELQEIINNNYATGKVTIFKSGQIKETIFLDKIVGVDKDMDGLEVETNGLKIHYSKSRTHAVPHRKKAIE